VVVRAGVAGTDCVAVGGVVAVAIGVATEAATGGSVFVLLAHDATATEESARRMDVVDLVMSGRSGPAGPPRASARILSHVRVTDRKEP
jgi:hypothetical protein